MKPLKGFSEFCRLYVAVGWAYALYQAAEYHRFMGHTFIIKDFKLLVANPAMFFFDLLLYVLFTPLVMFSTYRLFQPSRRGENRSAAFSSYFNLLLFCLAALWASYVSLEFFYFVIVSLAVILFALIATLFIVRDRRDRRLGASDGGNDG